MNKTLIWVAIGAVFFGGVYLLITNMGTFSTADDAEKMMEDEAMMQKEDAMTKDEMIKTDVIIEDGGIEMMENKGSYESYAPEKLALAETGKVVLYFHADWCPICRPLDAEFKTVALPVGTHVLKVNYDTATDLKKKYGVTYQHTFVQVDANGNLLKKWGDATTVPQVLARVQ